MEASPISKVALIYVCALGLTSLVLDLQPRRVINAGGCGPRALYAVASRLGQPVTEEQVLSLFPNHGFEVSIEEMQQVAPKLRLKAYTRHMTLADLKRLRPLGVLHVDGTHFVAIVGYEGDCLVVKDLLYTGENGLVRWPLGDLSMRWDGEILVVSRK